MVAALTRVITAKGGMRISTPARIPLSSRYPPRISPTISIGIDAARLDPKNFRQTSTQMYPYIGCTSSAPGATSYPSVVVSLDTSCHDNILPCQNEVGNLGWGRLAQDKL